MTNTTSMSMRTRLSQGSSTVIGTLMSPRHMPILISRMHIISTITEHMRRTVDEDQKPPVMRVGVQIFRR